MNKIERVLYGLTKDYYITGYWRLRDDNPSIEHLRWAADKLSAAYPGTERIYIVDNTPTIRMSYFGVKRGNLEDRVLFKILLEEEGVQVII